MGGSGFIGKSLIPTLAGNGHRVTILTRKVEKDAALPQGAALLEGNPMRPGPWQKELRKNNVVINLVGASIFNRWTKSVKKTIMESRIFSTRNIAKALERERGCVSLLLNASAVGYYGFHGDELLDESAPAGDDFLASVVKRWESEARRCEEFGVRTVLCRFGLVIGRSGGALSTMSLPFKFFMGSPLGDGKQWLSWIHEQDLASMIVFLFGRDNVRGPVNFTAPHPVCNRELTETFSRILRRPVIIPPVPRFVLRIILGELSSIVVKGQRVIPSVMLEQGYQANFPTIQNALEDLLG